MTRLFYNKNSHILYILLGICLLFSCSSSGDRKSSKKKPNTTSSSTDQIRVCSWNIQDFGHTKSEKEINFIAKTICKNDIVAIQEVVGKSLGSDAVIRLAHSLDSLCKSCHWDYAISLLTSGHSHQIERYAYLWKRNKVSHIGLGWLDSKYSKPIEREPFLATFELDNKRFTLVNFHIIPKSKQPEKEIKYLKYFPEEYPERHLIFLGDFNTPETNTVFNPLKKMGYKPALQNQKTTLRQKCLSDGCLASAYDNIFYPEDYILFKESSIIPFYKEFNGNMKKAKKISDHVPIFLTFEIK